MPTNKQQARSPQQKDEPVARKKPSKARGAVSMPETDVLGRDLVGDSPLQDILVERIEPDPHQGRWILPSPIRAQFQSGQLTAAQALDRWRKLAAQTQKQQGKRAETHPETVKLAEIEGLAKSIASGGQVNPITVTRHGDHWRIETGERRFWAHVWLANVEKDDSARMVPAVIRPTLDPFRQAVENLHFASLNAIATARTIARLVQSLTSGPGQVVEPALDFAGYREIASARIPRGGWKRIREAMNKSDDILGRHLRLLLLPDEALDLADRYDLTEKQLRPVMELDDPEAQKHVVDLIVELRLPSSEVEWLCRQPDLEKAEKELRQRLSSLAEDESPRAKHTPSHVLYNRVYSLIRLTQGVERGGEHAAEALAREYVANRGEAAEKELAQLVSVLDSALEQLRRLEAERTLKTDQPAPDAEADSGLDTDVGITAPGR